MIFFCFCILLSKSYRICGQLSIATGDKGSINNVLLVLLYGQSARCQFILVQGELMWLCSVYTHARTHACMNTCACTHTHTFTHTHIHPPTHTHTHTHSPHTHVHTCTHTHTHTHTHTFMHNTHIHT